MSTPRAVKLTATDCAVFRHGLDFYFMPVAQDVGGKPGHLLNRDVHQIREPFHSLDRQALYA